MDAQKGDAAMNQVVTETLTANKGELYRCVSRPAHTSHRRGCGLTCACPPPVLPNVLVQSSHCFLDHCVTARLFNITGLLVWEVEVREGEAVVVDLVVVVVVVARSVRGTSSSTDVLAMRNSNDGEKVWGRTGKSACVQRDSQTQWQHKVRDRTEDFIECESKFRASGSEEVSRRLAGTEQVFGACPQLPRWPVFAGIANCHLAKFDPIRRSGFCIGGC
ncbi:hypothetical protein E2C01_037320 [Portunus trituberculatus]|uniref:Uncharacterized protein n=1 Tax=Portunus trituberculatus TaxID=210409 RepID=A0A5B7FFB5_PORTR|nr:hypothetical protein [Portunus trituberculatus]